jgi:dienelactone hydrolase
MTRKTALYRIDGMDEVEVRRDLVYVEAAEVGEAGRLDLYLPPDGDGGAPLPVVVLVAGYPDPGMRRFLGCSFKEMGASTSWARLIAASGMAAIVYSNREPAGDLRALLSFVRERGVEVGLDPQRIALWAASGNAPLALQPLLRESGVRIRAAAFLYGALLDLEGGSGVAEMSRQFGFVNPCAGRSVDDLDPTVPLLLARAGQDAFPAINEAMARFLAAAVARNLPVTFVNHPEGPHAFDLELESERTREIVRLILEFLRSHLLA